MIKEIIAQGKDLVEAKENARAALGVGELEDVNFEILHMGSRGILGIIGVKPAKVRAYIEIPDREERPRRHERPRREKNGNEEGRKPEAAKAEGEQKEKPAKKKNNKPQRQDKPHEAKPKEDKPRTQVIPEAELKMELRTVEKGEDTSFDFVNTLIGNIGISAEAQLYACEDGTRRITITGTDASVLIGHHGDTLDALQYLANLAAAQENAKGERDKSRVTIDIEGYRAKREDTLRALARRMAQKALRNKRSVMLEPMTAYERRIIHSEIQNIEGVSTNSIGSDNNRKIVIYLTDKKPKGIFEEETVSDEEVTENAQVIDQSAEVSEEDSEVVSVELTAPAEEIAADEDDFEDIK